MIKLRTVLPLLLIASCTSRIQENKEPTQAPGNIITQPILNTPREVEPLDKSPMDIAWFPVDYPLQEYQGKAGGGPIMRIIYSRPHLLGRKLGKDVALPDTLWRMGANENNEIEFFKDVQINGKTIRKGKYILFCQPHTAQWQLYISPDINTWGLKLDTTKAILKTTVPVEKPPFPVESLTMRFTKSEKGASLLIYWGDAVVAMPVVF